MTDAAPVSDVPPSRDIPFVSDALRVLRVPFSPGAVFEEQVAKPAWFVPWIVISLLSMAVGFLSMPYTERIMDLAMASRGGGAAVPPAARTIGTIFSYLGLPILALIISLVGALVMWVTLMVSGGKVRFSGLLSASVFAKIMFVFQALIQMAIWRMRGTPAQAITTMADAQVAIGLDLLVPADAAISPFVKTMLSAVNPLSIWGLIITAVGIMVLEKQPKGAAWTAAIISFLLLVLISAAFAGQGGGAGGPE